MTRALAAVLILATILAGFSAAPVYAQTDNTYVVQPGDTLVGIAARYGITTAQLAAANGLTWNSWVYVGQRLVIPGASTTPSPTSNTTHVVQVGDTLHSIALRYGTTVSALLSINGLTNPNYIYVGQRLTISGSGTSPAPVPQPAPVVSHGAKWIDVNLSTQTLTAYADQTPVFQTLVSTGTAATPTVVGNYNIYVKYVSAPMSGPGYYLPDVPYIMYFYHGYSLHGTYWHSNFGTPMSHGCVNLSTPDAEWLFNWAEVGTPVVTHY
jgi:LysM repeat protein